MPPKLRDVSGRECVKILCNKFGFRVVRQRGSHIVLRKDVPLGAIGTVVPDHDVIKHGTLKSILRLARVSEDDFLKEV